MKKTLYSLFAILALCLFAGCSDDDDTPPVGNDIVGEWELTSWTGDVPAGFSAYAVFNADATFTLYQKVETVRYQIYTGSFRLDGQILSGEYANGTPWGASYEVEFDQTGKTMRMVSQTPVQEVSTFTRTTIPADIVSGAVPAKASRAEGFLFF